MIRFGEDICRDLPASTSCEWLETNGIGGYASSTVVGLNTRRYHGLLVAATKPPVGRMVLLSKLEEAVVVNGQRHELSTNRYPGTVHPEGYRLLREFSLDPFPVFVYEADSVEIKKQIFMVDGENTTVIEYEFRHLGQGTPSHCVFEVRPLIAFRDYHATTRRNDGLNPAVLMEAGTASIAPYPGMPTLYFAHNATLLEASGDWYYNFEYEVDRERGFEDQEDLFSPFIARLDLSGTSSTAFIVSTQRHDVKQVPVLRMREMERRADVISKAASVDPLVRSLTTAADQFVVRRGERRTIIAGYHWFGDWGRDAMIALPGLTLSTGRPEIAREILLTFASHADRGMLPNRFPEAGERPEYNTVDATLWMFEAVRAYLEYTNDREFLSDEMYGVLAGIIEWHQRGARFGIRVDNDGLLGAGEPGVQLTWMDAKVGDLVVTPRRGKPVEIQALWYNALRVMRNLAGQRGDTKGERNYGGLAEQVLVSFNDQFWDEQRGYLFDVVDGQVKDGSLRPNQILAVSLQHSMLSEDRARRVVDVVEKRLLTPRGLRTLSPDDPRYRGRYLGDVYSRDTAYHQGTVWPWLIGPFFSAWLKVHGPTTANVGHVRGWLREFANHLGETGLDQISEMFDADAPHQPRGCIAQAWSVAMVLKLAIDILRGQQ